MIEFYRKFVLSSALVFYAPGSSSQVIVASIACVIFLCLVSSFEPYQDQGDDTANTISYVCLVLTLQLGMALKMQEFETTSNADSDRALFSVLMVVVNVALLLFSFSQMIFNAIEIYLSVTAARKATLKAHEELSREAVSASGKSGWRTTGQWRALDTVCNERGCRLHLIVVYIHVNLW